MPCVSGAGSQVAGEDAETAVCGWGRWLWLHPPGGGGAGPGRQGGGRRLADEEDQRQRAEWRCVRTRGGLICIHLIGCHRHGDIR